MIMAWCYSIIFFHIAIAIWTFLYCFLYSYSCAVFKGKKEGQLLLSQYLEEQPMYNTFKKNKQRGKHLQLLVLQSWKSDNFMGSNKEKSNIAISIMEKIAF